MSGLPPHAGKELKEVGWTKGLELAKAARRDGQELDCPTWLHSALTAKRPVEARGGDGADGVGAGPVGVYLLQAVHDPDSGHRAGDRGGSFDAGYGQVPELVPGDDLR